MLGERLKRLRGKRTQEEVAEIVGLSRARYSHYENGRSEPDHETLQSLAKYFGVTVDYLLGSSDIPTYELDSQYQVLIKDPQLADWFKELNDSPEEKVEELRQIWNIIKNRDNDTD